MNITSFIQQRENGTSQHRGRSHRKAELFLEAKFTKSFVNKSCEISGRCRSTFVMQFSPDGTKVASTHGDHSVRVTEIATGKCLHTLHGHPRTPWCLAYHPSYSNILASGCLGGQVRIWDLYGHGCEVWQSENDVVIASVTFHPTDKVLVIAAGNTIYFWDWDKPEPFAKCSTGHEFERIRWIHFDSLGQMLYTGISNNISLHTDEVTNTLPTRVVPRSCESRPPERQPYPTTLGVVYNNIVDYYQDYRRGRLFQQLRTSGPQGSGSASSSSSTLAGVGSSRLWENTFTGNLHPNGLSRSSVSRSSSHGQSSSNALGEISETLSAIRRNELFDSYNNEPLSVSSTSGLDSIRGNYGHRTTSQRGRWRIWDHVSSSGLGRAGLRHSPGQSVFSNLPESERDLLLHPPADPFLSATPEQSSDPILSSATESLFDESHQLPGLESDNTSLAQPWQGNNTNNSLGLNIDSQSPDLSHDLSHDQEIAAIDEVEIPLESVTGQYASPRLASYRSRTLTCPTLEELCASAASNIPGILPCTGNESGPETCNNDSLTVVTSASMPSSVSINGELISSSLSSVRVEAPSDLPQNGSSEQICDSVTVKGDAATVIVDTKDDTVPSCSGTQCTIQQGNSTTSGNSVPSALTDSAVLTVPQSPLLTRYLTNSGEKSNQHCNGSSRRFRSIRERLQSSLDTMSGLPCAVPKTDEKGIPKVTVIMGNELEQNRSHQSTSVNVPSVSDTPTLLNENESSRSAASSNEGVNSKRRQTYDMERELSRKKIKTADVSVDRNIHVPSTACSDSAIPQLASASLTTATTTTNVTRMNSVVCSMPQTEVSLTTVLNAPTTVSSTNRHSSLLHQIFQAVDSPSFDIGSYTNSQSRSSHSNSSSLSSFRAQPNSSQNQNHAWSLPLMGPYLQSRGLNPYVPQTGEGTREATVPPAWRPLNPNIAEGVVSLEQRQNQIDSTMDSRSDTFPGRCGPVPENNNLPFDLGNNVSSNAHSSAQMQPSANRHTCPSGSQSILYSVQGQSSVPVQGRFVQGQSSLPVSMENEVELVVDQNENYTTNRNFSAEVSRGEEIIHRNHDSNNNSIHITLNANPPVSSVDQDVDQRNRDYVRLRDSFVSMTDQIEREMNDLNRRINALRDSFHESLRSLRHDRRRYETLDGQLPAETATNLEPQFVRDENVAPGSRGTDGMMNTERREPDTVHDISASLGQRLPVSQPPTLLETSLRSQAQVRQPLHPRLPQLPGDTGSNESHHWRTLQRHHLHPHYSSSILDETINRPNNVFQSAINRAIAGAFMGAGEANVANNIMSQTHRIQFWDFTKCQIPDISQSKINIVVPHCKLHNSASADISQDNSLLATFVPNHQGFPDNNILAVYSLLPSTRGQCLYTKQFGPNAVSVSISPSNNHILVCLAARRLTWVFSSQQLVAQIFKLEKKYAGENSMKHIKDVDHLCSSEIRTHVSGNSARWLPLPGQGLVYGTNRGDLNICRHGVKVITAKVGSCDLDRENINDPNSSLSSLLSRSPWDFNLRWNRVNSSTQTGSGRLNAGTQTPNAENDR